MCVLLIHIYTYIYLSICRYAHVCVHICLFVGLHSYVCTHLSVCRNTHIHTHVRVLVRVRVCVCDEGALRGKPDPPGAGITGGCELFILF